MFKILNITRCRSDSNHQYKHQNQVKQNVSLNFRTDSIFDLINVDGKKSTFLIEIFVQVIFLLDIKHFVNQIYLIYVFSHY